LNVLSVKSASNSLEWTTPNVPKPLNEKIDALASSLAAYARMELHSIATRMKASALRRERRARKRSRCLN
jgi:hypothetical protein